MKRIISLLLCTLLLGSLVLPVSAAIFQVSYYEEEIYAGGVLDLYAFPNSGGVEPFTYQWQAEGFGWIDLEDNGVYSGTKTNHLRLYTQTGDYGDFGSIPFQCVVTDAEGTTFFTPNIYPEIYSTENLIPNMRKWGYGLYEPTLTNVSNLSTSDYKNYTATAYAGSKIDLSIGSKSVDDKEILRNSEVKLTRQIHITEYGHTTKTTDKTTYIPYTVGTVKVEYILNLSIGSTDLGTFDSKTVTITTTKPDAIARGVTKKECSMLRYPYNESEKLGSLPQDAVVEVLGKEGGYYQVYVRNVISYIPESLLRVDEAVEESVIKDVNVTIDAPVAGQNPSFTCKVNAPGCELYKTDPVTWLDETTGKFVTSSDQFQEGHSYKLSIWLAAKSGYRFQTDSSGKPKLTGAINGNLPPYIYKAYEQDPEKVIELIYTFPNVKAKEPAQTHTCVPVLVKRVEPTCTEKGHEAYYYCSCGMCYQDSQGKTAVNISTWGSIPATGHTPSNWRYTQVYHYKACTSCGDMLEQADHTGGSATCTQKAKCSECGYAYGREEPDHRWSPTWLYQVAAGHAWICADCKTNSDIEPHTPGPAATETTPQTCKDCGYIIEPAKNHTHSLTKVAQVPATCVQEGSIEHYICSGCSDRFTDAAGKNRISADKGVTLGALGHTTSDTWSFDSEYHWRTCTVCQAVLDETQMLHEAAEGTCVTCGFGIGAENAAPPADSTQPELVPVGTEPLPSEEVPISQKPAAQRNYSWAMAVMIGLVCFGASITATVIILKKKKN